MTRCCVLLYTGDRSDRTTAMRHSRGKWNTIVGEDCVPARQVGAVASDQDLVGVGVDGHFFPVVLRVTVTARTHKQRRLENGFGDGLLCQHGRGGGEEDQRQDQHELRHSPPAPRTTNTTASDPPSDTFSNHMRFRFSRS